MNSDFDPILREMIVSVAEKGLYCETNCQHLTFREYSKMSCGDDESDAVLSSRSKICYAMKSLSDVTKNYVMNEKNGMRGRDEKCVNENCRQDWSHC